MVMFSENNRAIYQQIVQRIGNDILLGLHPEECRLPSVRELASAVEVNANTVMRAYEALAADGVIYNRRGIGFFVAAGAADIVRRQRREQFLNRDIKEMFQQLAVLGIAPDELAARYENYLTNNE